MEKIFIFGEGRGGGGNDFITIYIPLTNYEQGLTFTGGAKIDGSKFIVYLALLIHFPIFRIQDRNPGSSYSTKTGNMFSNKQFQNLNNQAIFTNLAFLVFTVNGQHVQYLSIKTRIQISF